VVGVGHSRLLRRGDVPLGVLALEAITRALDDAGLAPSDIDGCSTSPYQPFEGGGGVDGVNLVTPEFVMRALKMDFAWCERQLQPLGASLINAINAVGSGHCRFAVSFRAMHNPSGRRYGHMTAAEALPVPEPHRQGPATQFAAPYGLFPPGKFALLATTHMAKYGSTREQLGRFVVRNRDQALKWEHGYWHQYQPQGLTLDQYLEVRMISAPLCLYDCDIPVQMAGAFIVTTADRASNLRQRPAFVLGAANPISLHELLPEPLDDHLAKGRQLARQLWKASGVGPSDIDVANLYDGFSVHTPIWAEALGLCEAGDGFAFAAAPTLPLNTSSGNLGAGRTHGICHILESVLQVQGRAGERQVTGAQVALAVTNTCDAGAGIVLASSPA
jgi:acetyl-CoA acetyltransferase